MKRIPLSLPLVSPTSSAPSWRGFLPATGWDSADSAPEPQSPQGEYQFPLAGSDAAAVFESPLPDSLPRGELLAPAGGPDAAYAALQHGADAIYLGLKKFSARAEAENFTLAEVGEVTAYAHALSPRRRVFVTINTIIRQDELNELVDDLAALSAIGVDAIIIQDLGVWALARRHFPKLELHASTQLAVHNRAGVDTLGRLGFARVVLARELTLEEVADATVGTGVETEVFVHGALCYSYSGLCLFSAQTLGRSGNRGKCAYSCRDSFTTTGAPEQLRDGAATTRDPRQGFPFSMKDLALPEHLPTLRAAGVSCFKIEGRKKSPLYVATTTDYYRRLLDGTLPAPERTQREADLQTVFSRPWTRLFTQSHKDKEVADRDTTGHRGTLIGRVDSVRSDRLLLTTARALQRHDGLQVDLPILGDAYGFPVDGLWVVGPGVRRRAVVAAPAGAQIEVALPRDHPTIPMGAPVYCSSSQEVKQRYRFDRPKPGLYRPRQRVDILVQISADRITTAGRSEGVSVEVSRTGSFPPARNAEGLFDVVRSAFDKLGDTAYTLGDCRLENSEFRFAPLSQLNALRRELVAALDQAKEKHRRQRLAEVKGDVLPWPGRTPASSRFQWSVKVDRVDHVTAFANEDWQDVEELIIDIARDHSAVLDKRLEELGNHLGRARIRLALPAITRKWEEHGLGLKIDRLRAAGWAKWEAANLSAWSLLGVDPLRPHSLDLATDWSMYVVNRMAARAVLDMGATRFALSPEDGRENMRSLLAEFNERAVVIVYQDTPLFIAESCAYANLIGGCPGKANCRFESMEMQSSHGERVTAIDYHCRTIVLNDGAFCLAPRLKELNAIGAQHLRADFIYRRFEPTEVRERWRTIRAGRVIPGGHAANFDRGIQ